jgi:hypothetical protein
MAIVFLPTLSELNMQRLLGKVWRDVVTIYHGE